VGIGPRDRDPGFVLRNARVWRDGSLLAADVAVRGDRVAAVAAPGVLEPHGREADLRGRILLPGLVNGHDHLDFSSFPPLGNPPYASVYEWAADVDAGAGDPAARAALAVPLVDRLFLGGIRNLLAGATAVAHHNPFHRSLAAADFPVRVLARYSFAHSPGMTPDLRRTYRTTDRRIPWMVHAAEGTDERCRSELELLAEANVLRQNTVIVHGISLAPQDAGRIAAARASVVWCPESNRRLYGSTAPVTSLRAAGVPLGLGSDSPVSGVRDPLSNLAAARREGVLGDTELIALATRETAAVARLTVGAVEERGAADLLAVGSLEELMEGRREAVTLVSVAGRVLYGEPEAMGALVPNRVGLTVDGAPRRLEARLGRRLARLLRAHGSLAGVPWLAGIRCDAELGRARS
jgi:cytosine/adenosine deaminase-related metal-dependent hydrolase